MLQGWCRVGWGGGGCGAGRMGWGWLIFHDNFDNTVIVWVRMCVVFFCLSFRPVDLSPFFLSIVFLLSQHPSQSPSGTFAPPQNMGWWNSLA